MIDPRSLAHRLDPPFILAPSFLLAEQAEADGRLVEGKALGTAELQDLSLLRDLVHPKDSDLEAFARARDVGTRVGWRKYAQVKERTAQELLDLLRRWKREKIEEPAFRKEAVRTMKRAWRDVFLAGIRASGTPPSGLRGKGDPMVVIAPRDDNWLRSAVQHEMRFLNKFLDAAVSGDFVMPLEHRAKMYVNALDAFYDSARIIGLPNNTIIHWVTSGDDLTCASCRFLAENSPYTTETLATTPRSGLQLCLCLTSHATLVYTRRSGAIPLQEVRLGDEVWTHRSRWRKVRAKRVNRSTAAHRYAVLVGPQGELTGVTSDHPVWTSRGWMRAEDAARANVYVLPPMWSPEGAQSIHALPVLRDHGGLDEASPSETPPGLPVVRARESSHGLDAVQCVCASEGGTAAPHAVHRPDRSALSPARVGRPLRSPVLGGEPGPSRVPVPLAVGEAARPDPRGVGDSSSQWELCGRPAGELGVQAVRHASRRPPGGSGSVRRALLGSAGTRESQLVGRADASEDVSTLRAGIPGDSQQGGAVADEVLLASVLRRGADAPRAADVRHLPTTLHAEDVGAPEKPGGPVLFRGLLLSTSESGVGRVQVRSLPSSVPAKARGYRAGVSEPGHTAPVLLAAVRGTREACAESAPAAVRTVSEDFPGSFVRCTGTGAPRFLLADLLSRAAPGGCATDSAVRLLREEVQAADGRYSEATQVGVGAVLLLTRVLPSGSPLYDLEVEDDRSFVAGGLTVHNSNDRCWLYIRRVSESAARRIAAQAKYTRDGFVRKLRKIKRTGHP